MTRALRLIGATGDVRAVAHGLANKGIENPESGIWFHHPYVGAASEILEILVATHFIVIVAVAFTMWNSNRIHVFTVRLGARPRPILYRCCPAITQIYKALLQALQRIP